MGVADGIAQQLPDCAVLDLNLADDTKRGRHARQRSVPFASAGYGDSVTIPDRFRDVPVVRKPVRRAGLARR